MYKKIMVPLDGSKLAECVLPHVETIARGYNATEVVLIQVVEPLSIPYGREISQLKSFEQAKAFESHNRIEAETYLKSVAANLNANDIKTSIEVLDGKAAEALSDYVNKNGVDLVVIATHGRSGVSRWVWGSVTDRLLRAVCVPVLMIRAPGCIPGLK
jgi:nucleotide-binding universal stress UspA family protein